jgi:predicted O-methyltransferase YrrM
MLFSVKCYLTHRIKGKTKFYIHSPFIFSFINNVMHDKRRFYCFDDIKRLRVELLQNKMSLSIKDLGAGNKKKGASERKISSITKSASIPEKYGKLLSHIVDYFRCTSILELGTCLGLSAAYLAGANSKATVFTLEGATPLADIAHKNFDRVHFKNIEIIKGDFSETLPKVLNKINTIDLAFIDGNHSYEPTINYFHQILAHITNDSILIFDDIHWSPQMHRAWKEICKHPKVTVTIDLFRFGIVFFRKEQAKENFILYF